MRSYLYPAFAMEPEDFEKALPAAIKISKTLDIPCRFIKQGSLYTICFQDKAVSKGIVYSHLNEKEMDKSLGKYAVTEVFYLTKDEYEKATCCAKEN